MEHDNNDTPGMSTVKRRRGQSLHLDLSGNVSEDLPAAAAVFLVLFDNKKGYKLAWQQSIPELKLDDSVEFKSLPSGLHNVTDDLVYFVHGHEYAGISAFVNHRAEVDRNALMLAVGALLPLSFGRLGKSWKHASKLKELAEELAQDPSNTQPLDEFWSTYQIRDDDLPNGHDAADSPSVQKAKRRESQSQQNGAAHARKRAISTVSALAPPPNLLSPHHPALSLPIFLNTFGPLVFPIYKAALLRKRLLLVGPAPVEMNCNFVYDISILSGIPSAVADLPTLEPLPSRLPALFSVGVHDTPILSSSQFESSEGWVACTTDNILASKPQFYDTLITLPPNYSKLAEAKVWPQATSSSGTDMKATQRDLRRYQVLRRGIRHLKHRLNSRGRTPLGTSKRNSLFMGGVESSDTEQNTTTNTDEIFEDDDPSAADAQIVESQSWSALAYDSFMWWASAGEKRTDLDEEEESDRALLSTAAMTEPPTAQPFTDTPQPDETHLESGTTVPAETSKMASAQDNTLDTPGGLALPPIGSSSLDTLEANIIAFFHRFTERILTVVADVIDSQDREEDDNDNDENDIEDEDQDQNQDISKPNDTSAAQISPAQQTTTTTTTNNNDTDPSSQTPLLNPTTKPDDDDDDHQSSHPPPLPAVKVFPDDLLRMGLDIWSESDRTFVRDLIGLYWGRECVISRGTVECCGVRIC